VGLLSNGDGPTVLIRCDLDGLPVTEETDLPYASKTRAINDEGVEVGVMHACGHDVHMTNLVGTARYLVAHKQRWRGKLIFIGQPAEEKGAGAKAMLDDGLFQRFGKPDYAIALHCGAELASGKVALRAGPSMANVDSVDITIHGRGGHGAHPNTTIDPIVIAAKLILDLQTIVSRELDPIDSAVVTVGSIHAGSKHNIIPDQCKLQLTIRSFTDEVRQQLITSIRRKSLAACQSAGAEPPTIELSDGTPALSNDPQLTERIREVLIETLGAENVEDAKLTMGGEDFSQYGRAGVPSLMFKLGTVDPRKLQYYTAQKITPPSLHSSK
jgi:amidohydrolase